jgi:polyhydroxyalkanoate synthesis repressor PhaR
MSQEPDTAVDKAEAPPVVVKKYANRRLYNTESSSYITLENLADMIRAGRDFVVYDAKSGEDITRGVLTQIIVDEESKGRAMLPTNFLRQLIGLYGDSLQGLVPRYLEQAMATFGRQQEQMRVAMKQTMGNFFPFGIEEVSRQNMAMMERAMSLFTPLYRPGTGETAEPGTPQPPAAAVRHEDLAALHAEIATLRQQLELSQAAMRQAAVTQAVATQEVKPPPATVEKLPLKPVPAEPVPNTVLTGTSNATANVEMLPNKSEPAMKKPAAGG